MFWFVSGMCETTWDHSAACSDAPENHEQQRSCDALRGLCSGYVSPWYRVVCPGGVSPCSSGPLTRPLHEQKTQEEHLALLILHLWNAKVSATASTPSREGPLLRWPRRAHSELPWGRPRPIISIIMSIVSIETLMQEAFTCFSQHPLSNFSGSYGKKSPQRLIEFIWNSKTNEAFVSLLT